MEPIYTTLISGALGVIGALSGVVISGRFNLRSKEIEYQNAYFKIILEKRIHSYEYIQALISTLKSSTVDEHESRAYHEIFFDNERFNKYFYYVQDSRHHELWLSKEMKKHTLLLQQELTRCSILEHQNIHIQEVGKQEYYTIAKIRDKMENTLLTDMDNLYDVKDFFKNKNIVTSFKDRNILDQPQI